MSSPVRKILEEVQKLSKQDRALLRAELDELDEESPEGEIETAWDEELARRVESVQDGSASLYTHEEVEQRMRQVLKR